MSSLILGCARSPESESLGSIQFPASGTSSLILQISKSHKQPYGLRFGSPGIGIEEINKMSEDDKVEVFFENNDSLALIVYLNAKKTDVEILPRHSESIFNGTIKDLLLAGRSEFADLTIKTSTDRKINGTLKAVRLSGSNTITINVSTWRIQFGL